MFLEAVARRLPDKVAYRMAGSGEEVTYGELERRTRQGAALLRRLALQQGDRVLVHMENNIAFLEVALACIRAGLYCVPAGTHLKQPELLAILADSGASVLVTSSKALKTLPEHSLPATIGHAYVVDGQSGRFASWRAAIADRPAADNPSPIMGDIMVYSSGTTGQPKGIRTGLGTASSAFWKNPVQYAWRQETGLAHAEQDVNLVTGPLYHIAPFNFACMSLRLGATAIVMEKFDAEWMLMLIEQYRVSHVIAVPTMLARLCMLDPDTRARYDLSSLRHIEHNSAPCPIAVKEQLIDWVGPIVFEIYGASEPAGATFIASEDWLKHKGSVGRPIYGSIHVLDEDHRELPAGEIGEVFFSGGRVAFDYLNAPDARRARTTRHGWFSYGDIGRLDEDGYLYLLDRKSNLIIVGGLNVYPLEVEHHLIAHPLVCDAAVIGVPDPIHGQQVKAFVQLKDQARRGAGTQSALIDYCRERMADFKCPTSIDFVDSLPRTEHGKLLKRYLAS